VQPHRSGLAIDQNEVGKGAADVETNPIAERSWRAGKRKCVGHGRPGSEACARFLAWRTEDAISLGGVGTRPSTMLAAPVQAEAIIGLNGRSCRRYG